MNNQIVTQRFKHMRSALVRWWGVVARLTLVLLCLPADTLAQSFAYVTNGNSNNLSVINTASNTVVATVPVGIYPHYPHGVAITPNGSFAYVTNLGSNHVSVINTASNTVVSTLELDGNVVAITPNGSFAYVTGKNYNVSVINTASNTVVATVAVGSNPSGVAITPNGSFAYVTNRLDDNVSVINTATNTVVATVAVGSNPWGVAITPNGSFAYVANNGSSNVSVINIASNTVVTAVPVGSAPLGVAITPNGSFAYVTDPHGNNVSVINTASNTVVATVPVGSYPHGLAITPNGSFAYVTNTGSNNVSVINTASNIVVTTVPVGDAPEGVAIAQLCTVPSITLEPSGVNTCPSGNASFSVTASGAATLFYQWRKDNVNLTDGGVISGATTATLSLTGTTSADAGRYDCVVTNSCGNATSSAATLTVNTVPTANAGADLATTTGLSAKIGANPTASGGTGALTISWSPSTGLSSTTVANPTATPSSTTTYTLTVTDANNCIGTDQVTVRAGDLVNSRIQFVIGPTNFYDSGSNQVRVDIAIKNISGDDIHGPLTAVITTLTSVNPVTIPNADGGGQTAGCYYDYSTLLGVDNILTAGETSASKLWIINQNALPVKKYKLVSNIVGDLDGLPKTAADEQPLTLSFDPQKGVMLEESGSTLADNAAEIPETYALHQNYPNPFWSGATSRSAGNPNTTMQFDLPEAGEVTLKIYNSVGQLVRTLVSGEYEIGAHKVIWNARNDAGVGVASGVYLAVFKAGEVKLVRRVVLMR